MDRFEQRLERFLAATASGAILNGARYAVFPPGKRIRPRLLYAVLRDLGVRDVLGDGLAMALELLHASSLAHDDLPALDNDDFRRGRPSLHKVFGEGDAILIGDALIPLAYLALAATASGKGEEALQPESTSDSTLQAVASVSSAFYAVCNGQLLDIANNSTEGDRVSLFELKTGALFGAAVEGAFILAGRGAHVVKAREVGISIGVIFQVVDDLIDHLGTAEKGRPDSSDRRNVRGSAALPSDRARLWHEVGTRRDSIDVTISEWIREGVFVSSACATRSLYLPLVERAKALVNEDASIV